MYFIYEISNVFVIINVLECLFCLFFVIVILFFIKFVECCIICVWDLLYDNFCDWDRLIVYYCFILVIKIKLIGVFFVLKNKKLDR